MASLFRDNALDAGLLQLRPVLFTVAYKMTRSRVQSEDIVHDVLLDFVTRQPGQVEDERKYLAKAVIYKCLDFLRRKSSKVYVGIDLPEPVADEWLLTEIRHDISFGVVVILQELNPVERACFVLRECFDFQYHELAQLLDLTQDNCRQIVHRAKAKISGFSGETRRTQQAKSFEQLFLAACESGDLAAITRYLKQEVVLYADGGGKAKAALNPLRTKELVLKYLAGIHSKYGNLLRYHLVAVNGQQAILSVLKETNQPDSLVVFGGNEEGIDAIYVVRNPDKLRAFAT
ncbi:MAG: sigma-70 family RNA polymerase sigma factor [Bacteroidota bacterium]